MEAAYDLGRVRLYLDGNRVGEGRLRPGTSHLFYDRSVLRHLADSDSEQPIGVDLTSDLRVGQDLEGRFVTYRDEEQSSPRNQFTGWIDELQISRLPDGRTPDVAASSGGLIKDVGPIRRYGIGGAWGKGGWARSFLDSDGTLYLQGHKKSLDGGRTFLSHTGPSLEEILLIPEGVIHRRKGRFLALDGPVEFVSPGHYKVRAWRSTDGLRTLQEEAVLRVPDGPRRARKGDEWFGLYLFRDVVEKPDGTLLTTIEGNLHTDVPPPRIARASPRPSSGSARLWLPRLTTAAPGTIFPRWRSHGQEIRQGRDSPSRPSCTWERAVFSASCAPETSLQCLPAGATTGDRPGANRSIPVWTGVWIRSS